MSACTLVNTTPNYDLPQNYDRLGVGLYKFMLDGYNAGVLEILGTGDGRSAFKNLGQASGGSGAMGTYDVFSAASPGGTTSGQAWNTNLANSFGNPLAWARCRFVGSTIEFILKRGSGTASGGEMFLNIAFSRGGFTSGGASATAIPTGADSAYILGAGTTGINVTTSGDFTGMVIATAVDVKQHVWWASRAPISGGAVPFSLTWHGQTSNSYGFAFFLDCILNAAAADTFPYVTGTMTGSTTLWTTAAGGGGTLPTAGADQNTSNVWSYSSQSLTWKRYMFSMIKTSPSPSVLGAGSIPGTDDSVQGRILPLYWFESTGSAASRNWKGKSLFFRGCTKYVEYPNTINIATSRPYLGLGFVLTPAKTSQSYTSSAAGSNSTAYTEPELYTYDLGAPSIGARSPAAGAISTSQSISFTITEDQAISNLTITAAFTNIGREETIYANGAYSTNYSSSTAVVGTSPDTTYTITRTDGWPDSFTLKISCGDPAGNSSSATTAYTVSSYLPSVSSISPAGGSALATVTTPVAFTVSDPTRLLRVNVFAIYPDLSNREELVFSQGPGTTTLEANYSGTATWTGATQVAFTGLYRTGGWPAAPTIKVVATDADNNAVSTTITAYTLTPGYAPTISSISPAAGSALSLVTTPVTFTAADPTGVLRVQVFASYANTGRVETVFDGAGGATTFKTGYSSSSTVTWTGTTSAAFSIVRDNGWDDAPTLSIVVTDLDSNVATSSPNYTLTPGYLPSVGSISPVAGSALAVSDAVALTISDPTSLASARVEVYYAALGRTELVYDGSSFLAPYDTYSTVSGTNSKVFSIRRNGGWIEAPTVKTRGTDSDAQAVTSSTTYTLAASSAPTVTISPTTGSTISNTATVTATISDTVGLLYKRIEVYYATLGRTDVIYDGSAFKAPYNTYSSISGTTHSLKHNVAWPDAPVFTVKAIDTEGQSTSATASYSLSAGAAPTISSVSPADLSIIANTDAVAFTVASSTGLTNVIVQATYSGSGVTEGVYASGALQAPYAALSTATASGSTSIAFSLKRSPVWLGDVSIYIEAHDVNGYVTTQTLTYTVTGSLLPVIGTPSPSPGTISSSQALTVAITSTIAMRRITAWAKWQTRTGSELIYDSDEGFDAAYDAGSSVSGTTTSKTLVLARDLGWADNFDLRIVVDDQSGNQSSSTNTYSVTGAGGGGPTIDNFSPASGTQLDPSDPISFDVTDITGVRDTQVWVVIAGAWELIWDGTDFAPGYSSSSRSAITNGYRYTVRRSLGWRGAFTIKAKAIDLDGTMS